MARIADKPPGQRKIRPDRLVAGFAAPWFQHHSGALRLLTPEKVTGDLPCLTRVTRGTCSSKMGIGGSKRPGFRRNMRGQQRQPTHFAKFGDSDGQRLARSNEIARLQRQRDRKMVEFGRAGVAGEGLRYARQRIQRQLTARAGEAAMALEPHRIRGKGGFEQADACSRLSFMKQRCGVAEKDAPVLRGKPCGGGEQLGSRSAGLQCCTGVRMRDKRIGGGKTGGGLERFERRSAVPAGTGREAEQLLSLHAAGVSLRERACLWQQEFGIVAPQQRYPGREARRRIVLRELGNPGAGFSKLQGALFRCVSR